MHEKDWRGVWIQLIVHFLRKDLKAWKVLAQRQKFMTSEITELLHSGCPQTIGKLNKSDKSTGCHFARQSKINLSLKERGKKEWEISYSHLSFSEDASRLVQIRLKQCCCLVLPFFTLLMCTPTDYPVLDLVTVKLCGEWELPFHWKQIGTKYKMGFFIWISILGRVGRI